MRHIYFEIENQEKNRKIFFWQNILGIQQHLALLNTMYIVGLYLSIHFFFNLQKK